MAIVHHLRLVADDSGADREINPPIDQAVAHANVHCMIHRRRKIVPMPDELSSKPISTIPGGSPRRESKADR